MFLQLYKLEPCSEIMGLEENYLFFLQITVDTNKPPVNLAEIFPGESVSSLYLEFIV